MDNREIDKLIAMNLFGWKKWKLQNPSRIPGQVAFEYETLVPPEYDGSNLQHLNMIIPHYSTDIAAAWQIIEKLKDEKRYGHPDAGFTLEYDNYHKVWRAEFGWTPEQDNSPSMAICLATLKAVGIEGD